MKKLLSLSALAALLALTLPLKSTYAASGSPAPVPVNFAVATDDSDVGIIVKYIGASASGTVQVSAGDLLFKSGVLSSEVAEATITGCGGTAGTLDVDNAACDTVGETVDRINASGTWVAVRQDSIQGDNDAGNRYLDVAAQAAKVAAGYSVVWDSSVALHRTRALLPVGFRNDISKYIKGEGTGQTIKVNPFQGNQVTIQYFNENITYGGGTSTIRFIDDPSSFALTNEPNSELTVFQVAGGASTTNKVLADFEFQPFYFRLNNRALVRVVQSTTLTDGGTQLVTAGLMTAGNALGGAVSSEPR